MKARKSGVGDLQLGFDMAPQLPARRAAESTPTRASPHSTSPTLTSAAPSGDAFEPPAILTVAELTRRITSLLEREIGEVCVEGEISNFRRQSSGHCYFTLKDAESQLPCVLFSRAASLQDIEPGDGMQVRLTGDLSVYLARGQYQLIVRLIESTGEGALRARFEELKRKLAAEGMFAPERKRPLPRFPRLIGVVTSPTGAALQDFLKVLHRRHPGLAVIVSPVRVQGRGAAAEIASAIEELSSGDQPIGPVDLIVVTRGGGSLEDLWEFNEEAVARAISTSVVPVVSAVGHEIDFTIADFTADLRAPTPSAAAELIAADAAGVLALSEGLLLRIAREAASALDRASSRIALTSSSPLFRDPRRRLEEAWQDLDRCESVLRGELSRSHGDCRNRVENLALRLGGFHPGQRAESALVSLESSGRRLSQAIAKGIDGTRARMDRNASVLAAIDPAATLARGFSITRDAGGRVVTAASGLGTGDRLQTELADGTVDSEVVPSLR